MTLQDVRHRVGRRGVVLLILGAMDVGIGLSFIDPTAETLRAQNSVWREQFMPSWAWGCLWIAVGIACFVGAFRRYDDEIGFVPAVGLKLGWSMIEFTGWVGGEIDQGYRPALVWLGFAGLILAVSGLRETHSVKPCPPDGGGEDAESR